MFLNVFISISIMHSEPNLQEIFFNPNEELNLLCSTLVRPYLEHCVPSLVQEMELMESTAVGHEADKGTTAEFPSPASLCFLHWNKIIAGKRGGGEEKVEKWEKKLGAKKRREKCFPSGKSDANRHHFCEQFKRTQPYSEKRNVCLVLFVFVLFLAVAGGVGGCLLDWF